MPPGGHPESIWLEVDGAVTAFAANECYEVVSRCYSMQFFTSGMNMTMKKKSWLIVGLLAACLVGGNTQHLSSQHLRKMVDPLIQQEVDQGKIPGAVLRISKNGSTVYEQAYGYARRFDFSMEPLEKPEKTTVHHLYDIASLTKVTATTTAMMWLADRGYLHVDDSVCTYIEAFNTPEKKGITIRHLLTHTAGLYEWYPLYYRADNRAACYALIGSLPLRFPIGAQRRYSDLGFVLLGQIIEQVSKRPLEQFLAEHIFGPLGMEHTVYNPLSTGRFTQIAATSFGNPYEWRMVHDPSLGFQVPEIDPDSWNGWRKYVLVGEVNDGNAWYANQGVSGAAGLFSTAADLQKLVDMLLSHGQVAGKPFVSAATIEAFLSMDTFKNGLGWMMDPENAFMKNAPKGSFGHTGFTGTSIAVVPSHHLSVILLVNRQQMGLLPSQTYYNVNPLRQKVFEAVMKWVSL